MYTVIYSFIAPEPYFALVNLECCEQFETFEEADDRGSEMGGWLRHQNGALLLSVDCFDEKYIPWFTAEGKVRVFKAQDYRSWLDFDVRNATEIKNIDEFLKSKNLPDEIALECCEGKQNNRPYFTNGWTYGVLSQDVKDDRCSAFGWWK